MYYEVPQAAVGMYVFFHGCAHNGFDHWYSQPGCEECRGEPRHEGARRRRGSRTRGRTLIIGNGGAACCRVGAAPGREGRCSEPSAPSRVRGGAQPGGVSCSPLCGRGPRPATSHAAQPRQARCRMLRHFLKPHVTHRLRCPGTLCRMQACQLRRRTPRQAAASLAAPAPP